MRRGLKRSHRKKKKKITSVFPPISHPEKSIEEQGRTRCGIFIFFYWDLISSLSIFYKKPSPFSISVLVHSSLPFLPLFLHHLSRNLTLLCFTEEYNPSIMMWPGPPHRDLAQFSTCQQQHGPTVELLLPLFILQGKSGYYTKLDFSCFVSQL